jgi:sirohydrochlorin ferrochelatase
MKAILLIDHGSRRPEANEMLHCMANLVQQLAGPDVIVRPSHMELAEPTIPQGFGNCVAAGATEVIALPYMVSPGRHSIEDIPEMVATAAGGYPDVEFRVTPAFGVHEKLAELILERTGIGSAALARSGVRLADGFANDQGPIAHGRCHHPEGRVGACGDACRANTAQDEALTATESP